MEMLSLEKELKENSYPGRGIVIGRSADGTKAVTAYFIMGRSENSRNRIFVEEGEGIRTQAFDPSKLVDPSLTIYLRYVFWAIRRSLQMVIRQTPSMREWIISLHLNSPFAAENLSQMDQTIRLVFQVLCMWKMVPTAMQCLF